jgi:hypothetical protein
MEVLYQLSYVGLASCILPPRWPGTRVAGGLVSMDGQMTRPADPGNYCRSTARIFAVLDMVSAWTLQAYVGAWTGNDARILEFDEQEIAAGEPQQVLTDAARNGIELYATPKAYRNVEC